jgi:hypothetical protein
MYDVRLTRDRRGAQVNSLPNITSYVAKNTSVLSVSTIYLAVPALSSLLAPLRYSGETHLLAQSHHLTTAATGLQYSPPSSASHLYVGVFGFSTTSYMLSAQAISCVSPPLSLFLYVSFSSVSPASDG